MGSSSEAPEFKLAEPVEPAFGSEEEASGRFDRLVREAAGGDEAALARLLVLLRPRLARFGARLCGQAGEDALQEAMLTLATKIGEFRGESDIYSWAFALVRSACSRQTRGLANAPKEPLRPEMLEDAARGEVDARPDARLLSRQRSEEINCALASLGEDLRAAVVLRDIEELRASETAAILGISVAALKSRLHRGRRALAAALTDPDRPTRGCPDIITGLSEEWEGDLPADRCRQLRRHRDDCADCRRRCQQLETALIDARQSDEERAERRD